MATAPPQGPLVIIGSVERIGSRLIVSSVEVYDSGGADADEVLDGLAASSADHQTMARRPRLTSPGNAADTAIFLTITSTPVVS